MDQDTSERKRARASQQIAATAFHEAGHAVIAWSLGLRVHRVTVIPSKDYLGLAVCQNALAGIKLDIDNSDRAMIKAEKRILVALAGAAAQKKFSPRSVQSWDPSLDYQVASDIAQRIHGSDDVVDAYLRWLQFRTEHDVAFHWPQISCVAQALIENKTLNGSEVVSLALSA